MSFTIALSDLEDLFCFKKLLLFEVISTVNIHLDMILILSLAANYFSKLF